MTYQRRLRDLREDHYKTQQQIADILGMSQTCTPAMSAAPMSCPCHLLLFWQTITVFLWTIFWTQRMNKKNRPRAVFTLHPFATG